MRNRYQASGGRHQRAGFTLVEILLAVSISVMVFFAMGSLLSKCFLLWKDATANWRLAQYARISRERILCGGFADPAGGLLAASNVNIYASSFALNVGYQSGTNYFGVCAYTNIVQPRMYLLDQRNILPYWIGGYDDWRWGVRMDNNMPIPDIEVDTMTALQSNDLLTISYRLRLFSGGKTNFLSHTIKACLVNKED